MVNKQLDPENDTFLMETNLPNPTTARVYVNLPEGNNDEQQQPRNVCSFIGDKTATIWFTLRKKKRPKYTSIF